MVRQAHQAWGGFWTTTDTRLHVCVVPPQDSLEGFAPLTHPRVPHLVMQCVSEIERRGLEEVSLSFRH